MRLDLDPADLAEVRRRVVDPVLAAVLRPGELSRVDVCFDQPPPPWWWHDDPWDQPSAWVQLSVGTEDFGHRICKVGFWLEEADFVAGTLAGELRDWICESTFGWAQVRDAGVVPLGPPPAPDGRRVLTVHVGEDGDLPLWEDGSLADPATIPLSPTLLADLRAWQQRFEALATAAQAAADAEAQRPARSDAVGVWVQMVEETEILNREVAAAKRRERAVLEWRAFVDELEPVRDALVLRLRAELAAGFLVPTPPRMP